MISKEELQTLVDWYENDRGSIAQGLAVLTLGIKATPALLDENADLKKQLAEKDRKIAELNRDLAGFIERY